TRKWANPEKIEQLAKKKFGDIVISPGSFLSPAQFEKTLALFSDEEAEEAKAFVKKHTTDESSGFTMVDENDKREAVNYIETVFDVVEDKTHKPQKRSRKMQEENGSNLPSDIPEGVKK